MDYTEMTDTELAAYSDWCALQDQRTEDPEGETYVDLDLFFERD